MIWCCGYPRRQVVCLLTMQALRQSRISGRAPGRRTLGTIERREERVAYLFLAPWLIGLVVFIIGPVIASLLISLTDWNLLTPPNWVGLKNYEKMFADRDFYNSLRVTFRFVIMSLPIYTVVSLSLALLLNQRIRGMYFFRTVLFMPSVIAGTAVAVLWSILLNPDVGVVNQVLQTIGIAQPPRWLASRDWAIPAVILMGLWGVGGGVIIYLGRATEYPAPSL